MMAAKDKGLLIVVSGPSGAGKGTICDAMRRDFPEIGYSISMTTRPPRPGEIDGVNYRFTDNAHFEALLAADAFLEYAKVYDHYYGTPKDFVFRRLDEGRHVMLEIDIQGAMQVQEKYPEAVLIFILPPSLAVLEQRLRDRRTDSDEVICKRLAKARGELDWIRRYDYVIINDDLQRAVCQADAILTAECRKTSRNDNTITAVLKQYKRGE